MFTGIYQSLVLVGLIFIYYIMDFILMRRYDRQRKSEGSGRSWDFTLLVFLVLLLVILQPIYLPWLGLSIPGVWGMAIQGLGLLIALGALGLHAWARLHLRHFYAERVEVLPGHQVVDTGPYALIRHPVISSFFGLTIGLFLVNPAATTLLLMLYTFWDFGQAARREEKLLSAGLPDYADYMKRTPRFLPRLRRRH
jgi:protein-S-isoprenylcysteine O-methyltransferase Ste14